MKQQNLEKSLLTPRRLLKGHLEYLQSDQVLAMCKAIHAGLVAALLLLQYIPLQKYCKGKPNSFV